MNQYYFSKQKNKATTIPAVQSNKTESFASMTTDPTAGWKTYRNEKYGFELKYPDNWTTLDSDFGVNLVPPLLKNGIY